MRALQTSVQDLNEQLAPRLELMRLIGEGRTARVFVAREPALGRLVAVKVLRSDLGIDETARLRFDREARALAALAHPNIVPIHTAGELPDRTPYIVMQLVEGRSLEERLAGEGPLDPEEARAMLAALASALAAAHDHGIVHRDVRPPNILCEEDTGRVLLTDFGMAALLPTEDGTPMRLTRTGEILGDPEYLSPEQLQGLEVTPESDVFSLGVVGFRILTGEDPSGASTASERLTGRLQGRTRDLLRVRPDVDPETATLLRRCIAVDPHSRPSARRLAERLTRAPSRAPPDFRALRDEQPNLTLLGMLARRRLPQLLLAYIGLAAGFISLVGVLVQSNYMRRIALDLSLVLAVAGLLATTILGWFHGAKGPQEFTPIEVLLLTGVVTAWLLVSVLIVIW